MRQYQISSETPPILHEHFLYHSKEEKNDEKDLQQKIIENYGSHKLWYWCGNTRVNSVDLSFRQKNISVTRCIDMEEERDISKSSFFNHPNVRIFFVHMYDPNNMHFKYTILYVQFICNIYLLHVC